MSHYEIVMENETCTNLSSTCSNVSLSYDHFSCIYFAFIYYIRCASKKTSSFNRDGFLGERLEYIHSSSLPIMAKSNFFL